MVSDTDIPTREQFVERAAKLGPLLKSNAAWAEENRRQSDETIEALTEAGIFRMRVPQRYGGYETDTRTLVEVATELGRADGGASWTGSVYWIPTWMAGLFPDEVQDEVFTKPDTRVCGTLSPGGIAEPVDGGVKVNGKWSWISGAWHADWQEIIAVVPQPEGEPLPVMALVPMSDLQIVDDWKTAGMRGTGSVTTVAQDVFVPAARMIPLPAVLMGQYATKLNLESPMFRSPLLPVASASSIGTIIGMAKGAKDAFFERLPDRKITYTSYEHRADAPITHHQIADAAHKVDEAEFHAFRIADLVDRKGAAGEEWTLLERAQVRGDLGAAVGLAKAAIEVYANNSGASSNYETETIQRIQRDIQAISLHALMNPTTNAELYGRVLAGLEPNTLYI